MMRSLVKGLVRSLLPPATIDRMKVAQFYKIFDEYKRSDLPEFDRIATLVRPGDHVLDIGSSVGLLTKLFSDAVGPQGKVHSFEPVPYTFGILRNNIMLSGITNVICYDWAISDADGISQLVVPTYAEKRDSRDNGSHRFGKERNDYASHRSAGVQRPGLETTTITVRSLDSIFPSGSPRISFIKCNAEGHDYRCIVGAHDILERDRPALLVEVAADPEAPGSPDNQVLNLLAKYGYRPYILHNGAIQPYSAAIRDHKMFYLTDVQRARV